MATEWQQYFVPTLKTAEALDALAGLVRPERVAEESAREANPA